MNDRRRSGAETSKPNFKKHDNQRDSQPPPKAREHRRADTGDKSPREDSFKARERRLNKKDGRHGSSDSKSRKTGNYPPKGKHAKSWESNPMPRIVSDKQVTDGKHRGRYLECGTSSKVRPTSRRIREVMLKSLFRRIRAGRFLDLCAGAGTIGIEAISRGALISSFVERSAKMCSFIKKNLDALEIKEGHGEVYNMETVPFLKKMEKRKRQWDVVYYDPPYDVDYDEVLNFFARGAALKVNGVLVIEHHAEMFFPEENGVLRRWKVELQGETGLTFYDRKQ